MVAMKRPADDPNAGALVSVPKKTRGELVAAAGGALAPAGGQRTSSLLAPIMLLTGHGGEIFTGKFHPEGHWMASSGFDRQIFLWNVYGECENIHVMSGHSGAVLELHFSTDGERLYTASTDKTVGVWDVVAGVRVKRIKGHTSFVNTCCPARRGPPLVVSGSDDCSIKVWDARKKGEVHSLQTTYPVTSVAFNDTAEGVMSSGVDNEIKFWDLRKGQPSFVLRGHAETVTSLSLSPDGAYLASNGMDNTVRAWDVRPYCPGERCTKVLVGHQHNFEQNLIKCSWSKDGRKVASGSADRCVYIWDVLSRRILYKLPGHNGSVNEVQFHPKEPIIMSVGSDKQIYLGEIEP